ncbi:MAG: hypothetical protein QOG42_2697, partial [Solirubrobacteraceae bacterium]|nr:hypothetical protein [Solirubrobacteraceae bacterium]
MSATSLRSPGPIHVGDRRGCGGRIRSTLSLSYQRRNWTKSRGQVTTILDLAGTRNANGQLATQTRDPAPPPATQTLTYDALDQLTQASTGSGPSTETYSYAHDVADRLTRIASPTADTTLVYDAANQLTQTTDTATATTAQTFAYDQLGNRTSQDPA